MGERKLGESDMAKQSFRCYLTKELEKYMIAFTI